MTFIRIIVFIFGLTHLGAAGIARDGGALTREGFIEALKDTVYQCSFTSYPKVRFFADRIEVLDKDGQVSRTIEDTKVIEPGVIINSLIKGGSIWFSFSDQLDTFGIGNMNDVYPFSFEDEAFRLETWPEVNNAPPMPIEITGHPDWTGLRIENAKVTPVLRNGDEGEPIPVIRFNDHVLWAFYKTPGLKIGASQIILSRDGKNGWWMEGDHLGSGAKTFRNRDFIANRDSLLRESGFSRRASQFGWYLLKRGNLGAASAQEFYTGHYLNEKYGPGSMDTIDGLKVMGELRADAMHYAKAPYWLEKARDLAKVTYREDPGKIAEFEMALARARVEAGEYDAALEVLDALPYQPDTRPDFGKTEHTHVYVISEASFGKGDYDKAATWQKVAAARAGEKGRGDWAIGGLLGVVACHLARGDKASALEALNEAIDYQEQRQKKSQAGTVFETHQLALACVALGQWDEALRYASEGNHGSSHFECEEAIRLLALWNSGEKAKAVALAKKIGSRFDGDFTNALRTQDSSELLVAIIEVLSSPGSEEKVSEFRKILSEQKELLRKRALKNYLLIYTIGKADRLLG